MKAKTVWLDVDNCPRTDGYHLYWLRDGEMVFNWDADIRWVNCYGYENGDVALKKGSSKILGDE